MTLWLVSAATFAQTISGKVINAGDGQPLPGVTILEKGSAKGTVTDSEGKYTLNLTSAQATVIFSYIGFTAQEIAVSGRSVIDVSLKEGATSLGEVVVTALGISKEKKALAYAVSEVKGSEFTQARENNVANALTGKIAGVNATGMATGFEPDHYPG